MGIYRVTGSRNYRGHSPGSLFEATMEPDEVRRAVRRRNIVVIDESPTRIDPRKVRRPRERG